MVKQGLVILQPRAHTLQRNQATILQLQTRATQLLPLELGYTALCYYYLEPKLQHWSLSSCRTLVNPKPTRQRRIQLMPHPCWHTRWQWSRCRCGWCCHLTSWNRDAFVCQLFNSCRKWFCEVKWSSQLYWFEVSETCREWIKFYGGYFSRAWQVKLLHFKSAFQATLSNR